MTEIHKLSLKDLYKLRTLWTGGIQISYQTQYIERGIQLRNNQTGKDVFFKYNKVFNKLARNFMDEDYAKNCFIQYTKNNTTGAKNARYIMKEYSKSNNKIMVDGYPFDYDQVCFLDSEFLLDNFEEFALGYVKEFIKYKEKDASPREIEGARLNPDDTMVYMNPDGSIRTGNLCQEIELSTKAKKSKTKEGKKMSTLTNAAERTQEITARAIEINKEAAILAAKLEVGRTVTTQIKNQIKVPWLMKSYKNHPLFDIALANVVGTALRELMPENEKAQVVGEAMVQSAMVEMGRELDLNKFVDDILKNVDLSKLMPQK